MGKERNVTVCDISVNPPVLYIRFGAGAGRKENLAIPVRNVREKSS
jgi:hypothetical protein